MASWTSGFDKQTRSPPPDRYRYYAEPDYSDYKGRDSGDRRRYSDFPPNRGFDDKRAFARSPSRDAYDDRSLKRKRSVSPPNRYVRFRYDEGHRGRSPGRRYSPEPRSRGPPDPILADNPVSFRNFIEWFKYKYPTEFFDDEQERLKQPQAVPSDDTTEGKEPSSSPIKRPMVKVRYDEYRKRFMKKQYKTMFEYHRRLAWFIEKYDPAERHEDLRARVRKEGLNGTIDQFILELEAGKHDPGQTPSQAMDTDDTAATTQETQDDDDTMGEEEPTKLNIKPANGHLTKPVNPGEISIMPSGPQLMIRTIPPDIGRIKLEQVFQSLSGFKYIAIGDPVQKRQFYRSGWVAFEFEEDVKRSLTELESKKIDNFKLPLTHITEPFVTKIRYTPACASKPERLEKDLELAKKLVAVYETQATQLTAYKPVWPVGAPADAPVPEQENGLTTEDDEDEGRNPNRGSTAVEERIDKLVSEQCDTDEDGNPSGVKKVVLALDLYLAYLREAFHVCYYCAVVTDHPEELIRKCAKHERRAEGQEIPTPAAEGGEKDKEKGRKQDGPSDERWAEILDGKIACLIDRLTVDPTDYGGTRYDDEVSVMVADWVKQEDENRWRCTECKKLFKAGPFVEKHVINKHPEHFKGKLDEWEFYNNFVLDPQRITPMLAVPVSMNGTTHHPPQAFGLPSGWKPDIPRYDGRQDNPHSRSTINGGSSHPYHDILRPMRRSPSPAPPTFLPPRRMTMSMFESSSTPIPNGGGAASSTLPVIPGLPAKPTDALGTSATGPGMSLARRMSAAPAPPPPGAKQDPRARVSYHDLDSVDASEDVALQY